MKEIRAKLLKLSRKQTHTRRKYTTPNIIVRGIIILVEIIIQTNKIYTFCIASYKALIDYTFGLFCYKNYWVWSRSTVRPCISPCRDTPTHVRGVCLTSSHQHWPRLVGQRRGDTHGGVGRRPVLNAWRCGHACMFMYCACHTVW